jgi:hypothetical protein
MSCDAMAGPLAIFAVFVGVALFFALIMVLLGELADR